MAELKTKFSGNIEIRENKDGLYDIVIKWEGMDGLKRMYARNTIYANDSVSYEIKQMFHHIFMVGPENKAFTIDE